MEMMFCGWVCFAVLHLEKCGLRYCGACIVAGEEAQAEAETAGAMRS